MRISDWSSDVCSSDLIIAVGDTPHLADDLVRFRLIGGMKLQHLELLSHGRVIVRVQRIVGEAHGLHDVPPYFDPEAAHPAIQPDPHGAEHGGAHIGIAPVEVRLLLSNGVELSSEQHTTEPTSLIRTSY